MGKEKTDSDLEKTCFPSGGQTDVTGSGNVDPPACFAADSCRDREVFSFVMNMNEIVFITGADRNILVASNLARELFSIPEKPDAPLSVEDYLPKVYVDAIYQRIKDDDIRRMKLTFPVKAASGGEVMLETRFNWFQQNGGKLLSITCRDINDAIKAMSELTEREDRYRTIFRESPIGFIHVNSDGFITDCNNSFLDIFGLDKFEVAGVCLADDNNLDIYPNFKKSAMDAVVGFSSLHEAPFSTNNGVNNGWVRVSFSPVISENNAFLGAIGIVENITEAKNAVEKISFVSNHDALTGLYNRRMCEESIDEFEKQGYLPLGVIYADLNCLKLTNDAFGHSEGDSLLLNAANILKDSAGEKGYAYRLGGDEFLLLLKDASVQSVNERIMRITRTCAAWKGDGLIPPSMALGGAVKLRADQNLNDIIKEAEDLMYSNKMRNGKPARMRILGSLEGRLHNMNKSSVGDRSKRIISWGEWFLETVNFKCDHDILRLLCRYHDVGLLACPDEIAVIGDNPRSAKVAAPMQHMAVGYRIAKCTAEIAGVAEYILSHHEWWDGMGYPNQQQGREIPRESRIIAIFDALEGMRCLHNGGGTSLDEALSALKACAGRQFDPELTERIVSLARQKPPKFLGNTEN